MTLAERLSELVDDSPDVAVQDTSTGFEYTRGEAVFAAHPAPDVVELRLGEEIADAALRTPDTSSSARGHAWVRFAPRVWDDHAQDRLEAWFRVAWRLAGEG